VDEFDATLSRIVRPSAWGLACGCRQAGEGFVLRAGAEPAIPVSPLIVVRGQR